jgi:hypothetical protein
MEKQTEAIYIRGGLRRYILGELEMSCKPRLLFYQVTRKEVDKQRLSAYPPNWDYDLSGLERSS